jgi:pyruvate,water dikinase
MVGEDDARASLAGQLETVLDIDGEESLLNAVRRCYSSVCSRRLHKYLASMQQTFRRRDHNPFSLALIVQEMVPAVAAGVAFSADPETGERSVIIEATEKSVDGVEGGTIEPARWVVDARGVLVEARGSLCKEAGISEEEVLHLAALVRRIAAKLGGPQDIEWAWDGERFWLLQTRPITTLVGKTIYSNRLVADMSPGLVKPLLWSTNTLSMTQNVFGRIFTELIGPNDIDFHKLGKRIHSRIYTNMTMLGDLLERIGLPANFFEMMARDEAGERPPVKSSLLRILLRARVIKFLWRHTRAGKTIETFVESQHQNLEPFRRADYRAATVPELMQQAEELMRLHGLSQWHVFLAAINMMMRKRLMDRFLKQIDADVSAADLLRGLMNSNGRSPDLHLRSMALTARRLGDDTLQFLMNNDDAAIRATLLKTAGGRRLLDQADQFMKEYGFLSSNGTDFTAESWVECPDLIWKSVSRAAGRLPEAAAFEAPADRRNAEDYIRQTIGPVRCIWFKRLLRSTLEFMALRERASLLLSEDAFQMRRVFLALGGKLAESGRLERIEDIFLLYIEELYELVENRIDAQKIGRLVRERREELIADAGIEPLDTICGDTIPSRLTIRAEKRDYLVGIAGSSGIIEGRVVIVRDPMTAPLHLSKKDILVVPYTDVGWTPLFAGIGGIVAETGGQLSHTSIIAREYNLPAVVSVRNATRLLRDGQPITVDGRSGRVHLGHILTNGGGE